jgi:hypothetical protein
MGLSGDIAVPNLIASASTVAGVGTKAPLLGTWPDMVDCDDQTGAKPTEGCHEGKQAGATRKTQKRAGSARRQNGPHMEAVQDASFGYLAVSAGAVAI